MERVSSQQSRVYQKRASTGGTTAVLTQELPSLTRVSETEGALLVCSPWVAERWLGVQGRLHSGIQCSALGLWSAPFNVSYPALFYTVILVLWNRLQCQLLHNLSLWLAVGTQEMRREVAGNISLPFWWLQRLYLLIISMLSYMTSTSRLPSCPLSPIMKSQVSQSCFPTCQIQVLWLNLTVLRRQH